MTITKLSLLTLLYQFIFSAAAWALAIVSPTENQAIHAGDSVSVIVKPSPGEKWLGVIYGIYKMNYDPLTAEYKIDIKIPQNYSGLRTLTVTGVDKSGHEIELKRNIFVKLPPNIFLQGITAGEDLMVLYKAPSDSSPEDRQRIEEDQITVAGTYSDGVKRLISSSALGTTYVSSDEQIVIVNSEGKLTAKGMGRATITVRNGKHSALVKVVVKPYRK